jgi:hypothetical protein
MPDGKTFLEAGGVVDEIVDMRAEEASAFAGPFARRPSQRLIARVALADAKDAIARVFVGGQCSDGNWSGSKSAVAVTMRLLWEAPRNPRDSGDATPSQP